MSKLWHPGQPELVTVDQVDGLQDPGRRAFLIAATATTALAVAGCGGSSAPARSPRGSQSPKPRTGMPDISADRHWVLDFSHVQDGPVPSELFNHVTGTGPPKQWGTGELENYTDLENNSGVRGGLLIIQAFKKRYQGSRYTSARLDSRGIFDFTYGKLALTMRMPHGAGTWPAAWLLPSQQKYSPRDAGVSPRNEWAWGVNGELDIVEGYGNIPNQAFASVHNLKQLERSARPGQENYLQQGVSVPGMSDDFHTFGIVKTPKSIDFTLNGSTYFHHALQEHHDPATDPYDQPFGLIVNLAMGGPIAGPIDNASGPWALATQQIEYTPIAA